ncbi:MAG: tryptophan 7-halogenase [Phycisphaerae bacterium]|nr:tryptophan 7-halogenase [Phycisphaerae bacterium]
MERKATGAGTSGGATRSHYDIVIVGGGPGGSTAATILKKYNPALRIIVLEKEKFPRDHIGESQLPCIGPVLEEMGCWDKVENAEFPIKLGGSFTWGRDMEQWDFDFYPVEHWQDEPRPGKFFGQRRFTAFQVDRSIYDTILLDHAAEQNIEVRQQTLVREVHVEGDRVTGVTLESGETITGRWYIDASGNVNLIRRALNIGVDVTEELKNLAIYDYWQNAEWAERIGVGATRIQVRSLPYGWIWFIPLGPTRTSIGLVCPVEHFKKLNKPAEELYLEALNSQPQIAGLIAKATREKKFHATKDWSQLSDRLIGENWVLVGEAAGFADPILSAGLSLTHASARDAAYTILEMDRGELDPGWLRHRYDDRHRTNIRQHIRFGQYWYAANTCFTDLKEHCTRIAGEAGLKLDPKKAWAWLAQGGFISESLGLPSFGSFDIASAKQILDRFDPTGQRPVGYLVNAHNVFKLNFRGAKKGKVGLLENGRIQQLDCWERGDAKLPLTGIYGAVVKVLEKTSDGKEIIDAFYQVVRSMPDNTEGGENSDVSLFIQALDVMIEKFWVTREVNKNRPMVTVTGENRFIRTRAEAKAAIAASESDNITINYTD